MAVTPRLRTGEILSSGTQLGAIMLFDDTLPYSTPGNEGGWGAPNLETTDITKTEYILTDPDGNETIIEDEEQVLPNVTDIGFKITADMLGLSKITPGVWTIKYKLTHAGGELCTIGYFLMYEEMLCCLDKLAVKFNPSKPLSEADREIFDLRANLCTAQKNAALGQYTVAQEIIDFLNSQTGCHCV